MWDGECDYLWLCLLPVAWACWYAGMLVCAACAAKRPSSMSHVVVIVTLLALFAIVESKLLLLPITRPRYDSWGLYGQWSPTVTRLPHFLCFAFSDCKLLFPCLAAGWRDDIFFIVAVAVAAAAFPIAVAIVVVAAAAAAAVIVIAVAITHVVAAAFLLLLLANAASTIVSVGVVVVVGIGVVVVVGVGVVAGVGVVVVVDVVVGSDGVALIVACGGACKMHLSACFFCLSE